MSSDMITHLELTDPPTPSRNPDIALDNCGREAASPPAVRTPELQNDDIGTRTEMPGISASALIFSLSLTTAIPSFLNGAIVVCLPKIAADIHISRNLLLWPASIFSLVSGCTLLLSGALVDVFGAPPLFHLGCLLQLLANILCGFSQAGYQFIAFRAVAGLANSLCLPPAVSITTKIFSNGKRRNIAFASMGGGQPVGFSIGLCLGGVIADTIGWKWTFYSGAILNSLNMLVAIAMLPSIGPPRKITFHLLLHGIDWTGALLASAFLAIISYVLTTLASSGHNISHPTVIALIILSCILAGAFCLWIRYQEGAGRTALFPTAIWSNRVFTSVCVNVFLVWGAFNATETLASLFFQYVQGLSALQTSVRLLPAPVGGVLASILVGLFIQRVRADVLSIFAVITASLAPLLMAIVNPDWPYWACIFPAMATNAIGADTLYTISNLVMTASLPQERHGIAGGVYNTIAQIGRSFGLTTSTIVANLVTDKYPGSEHDSPLALLDGYRAAFWYCFAANLVTLCVVGLGLRRIGRVGVKDD
ncbi:MFS general substrate transporter [Aspergillus welwitschiae]|uniref:MFS general substrate transporter n=1 Tax=Aspergillus welwitschiae TaxID=1341132 RepID=A0A3F3PIP7_9EURO|nr:MFS general substrate transporter [Aspergillus welwitschiae]RDH26747.1 MFS general substrate transporter [Aspergillus welwitschiae]